MYKAPMDSQQILTVAAFGAALGKLMKLAEINIAEAKCDLLWTSDAQALPLFEHAHEMAGLHKRFMCARVEPCEPAIHDFDSQFATLHIGAIDVGDFQLTSPRRF